MPSVYSLTDLTGRRKNDGRTMIISGIEVGRRTLIVFSLSGVLSLVPTLMLLPFFGILVIAIVPPIVIAASFIFFEGRSRRGLQVRRYREFLDKRQNDANTFYVCFQPTTKDLGFTRIVASAEPIFRPLADAPNPVFTSSRRLTGKRKPA
ncbi:hypothetical protein [Curtobacterium sp. MCSS17_016]|uniref:hypothetical protein n=1 Tax=Curtobacterium sp. MCSS17_016 TaxID=2175644 RepID=UPI0011B3B170|nr:hypothetical protein [Curtobacterium sp. MCSS17_016]WIE80970.1 hypothetical protein DEJ19_020855 [Curtobacterium sp. MCSS17_016]